VGVPASTEFSASERSLSNEFASPYSNGRGAIDLYHQHRVDPNTPIEDTVGAMAHRRGCAESVAAGGRYPAALMGSINR